MWKNYRDYIANGSERLLFQIFMRDGTIVNGNAVSESGLVIMEKEGLRFTPREYPEQVKDVYYIVEKEILR
jgi:hypothetical protein